SSASSRSILTLASSWSLLSVTRTTFWPHSRRVRAILYKSRSSPMRSTKSSATCSTMTPSRHPYTQEGRKTDENGSNSAVHRLARCSARGDDEDCPTHRGPHDGRGGIPPQRSRCLG